MRKSLIALAVIAAFCTLLSCKGRHADATPNGETIDVVVTDSIIYPEGMPTDSLSVPSPAKINKVMEVSSNN